MSTRMLPVRHISFCRVCSIVTQSIAARRRNKLTTRNQNDLWGVLCYSPFNIELSTVRLEGYTSRLQTARPKSSHKCFIGLQWGKQEGCRRVKMSCLSRKFVTRRALWSGHCRLNNLKVWPYNPSANGIMFFSIIYFWTAALPFCSRSLRVDFPLLGKATLWCTDPLPG